ncbi:MAG TPA: sigma 54-interacting transcriptional regulator, partial [Chromatiaceae bacterium]|nr:sigma 54-interacting transcriptional regulator [Chromatiaceae bacterium]
LRVLQEKKARPVGGQREVPIDVRLISATHRDLATEVASSRFRQDLFYRINVIELHLPPLRERTGDIPLLAEHFLTRIAHQNGMAAPGLTAAAHAALARYAFPGNVRELENVLERALALAEGDTLETSDLYLPEAPTREAPAPSAVDRPEPTAADISLEDSLGEIQRQAILLALEENHWNRTAAAKKLGMSLRALRYRLAKLGIE